MECFRLISRPCPVFAILVIVSIILLPLQGCASGMTPPDDPPQSNTESTGNPENSLARALGMLKGPLQEDAERLLREIVENNLPGREKALFLLGRTALLSGDFEEAQRYLLEAAEVYPLLRDYSLKLLSDLYDASKKYEEVLKTAKQINNPLLAQRAMQAEIGALLALSRKDDAKEALLQYLRTYPRDWDRKWSLAMLLKEKGETDQAVQQLKDVYLNAAPLSDKALKELTQLGADTFSGRELLQRAGVFYKNHNYRRAESLYKDVLNQFGGQERERIIFLTGLCQFNQKRYADSAATFGLIESPKALYWQARSYYRINKAEEFIRTKKTFDDRYPDDKHLALLYLMDADELRRKGRKEEAERSYRTALERFPDHAEDALWGLAWLKYTSGNFKEASEFLTLLSAYRSSEDYLQYLFWMARSRENLTDQCMLAALEQDGGSEDVHCGNREGNYFRDLPADDSYYGFLIKLRSRLQTSSDEIKLSVPQRPQGKSFERIEALTLLGLKDEAAEEIAHALKSAGSTEEFLYLIHMAMRNDDYRKAIYYAESKKERELLPYSYPLGYWDVLKSAAETYGVDPYLVAAIIREESRFDADTHSRAGAVGLMQVMPATARKIKEEIALPPEEDLSLRDPAKNILLGTYYLSRLIEEFREIPLAIAAYNAGKNILKEWILQFDRQDREEFIENIPYNETRRYVKKVLKSYWQYRSIGGLPIEGAAIINKEQ